MVWSTSGIPLQGLTGDKGWNHHIDFPLTKKFKKGEVRAEESHTKSSNYFLEIQIIFF